MRRCCARCCGCAGAAVRGRWSCARPTETCSPISARPWTGAIDVAAGDEMADFQDGEQHGEQDRRGIGHARRHVVGAPPQQIAGIPERCRRHAIAIEQPVEDRRGADIIADNARLLDDARRAPRRRPPPRANATPAAAAARRSRQCPAPSAPARPSASLFRARRSAPAPAKRRRRWRRSQPAAARPGRGCGLLKQLGRVAIERGQQQREAGERESSARTRRCDSKARSEWRSELPPPSRSR